MATTIPAPRGGILNVTYSDEAMLKDIKKAISMVKGVTKVKVAKSKPRLYDPETGEYLNDKTMKAIEDVRSGKDKGYHFDTFEDFKTWCETL